MPNLRITTFNLENLFCRYAFLDTPWTHRDYDKFVQALDVVSIASRKGDLVSYDLTEIQRNNTARAILDCEPDILAVQEVENLQALRIFNQQYLDDYFDRMLMIDGNDLRGIDVGLLIRTGCEAQVVGVRTHVDDPVEKGTSVLRRSVQNFGYKVENAVFSRDCLEVDVSFHSKVLTFMVNHFKAQDQTQGSKQRRTLQAKRVAELVDVNVDADRLPIVLGDFNADWSADPSLDALKDSPALKKDIFPKDTWTHYYTAGKEVSRLDYILVHKSLKAGDPEILRNGLTTKCRQYKGDRYPTIGQEHTEASDHCPVSLTVTL